MLVKTACPQIFKGLFRSMTGISGRCQGTLLRGFNAPADLSSVDRRRWNAVIM